MKIVLLGFMCSGKTKTGQILSQRLGWPHYDTDSLVEKKAGKTIAELINKYGEGFFRDLEKEVVKSVCEQDTCIISTGGGVPLNSENMENLRRESAVVWLRVSPKTVLKRIGNIKTRPLLDPKRPLDSICDLLQKRRPFYEVADHHIVTDDLTPEEVAEQIYSFVPKSKKK